MLKNTVFVFFLFVLSTGLAIAGESGARDKVPDHGRQPWVVDIEDLTEKNDNFRTTMWTGMNLQMTVMSIKPRCEIGLEIHDKGDQFIRIEKGRARVVMGKHKDKMTFDRKVADDWAIFIPEGFWHNIINEGDKPLKIYVIYAPPAHPAGTVHRTIEEAEAAHGH